MIARDRGERLVRTDGRYRVEVYRPDADPSVGRDAGSMRIEARRPERRLSLDVNRIERSGIERRTETRNREGGAERLREDQPEFRTPEREIHRDTRDSDGRQGGSREREVTRQREAERPSMKEYIEQRKQEFARPEERSREQWFAPFYERREMMRERPTGRERISPPSIQREPVRPAPEMQRGGESQTPGGSRGDGRKRNRD